MKHEIIERTLGLLAILIAIVDQRRRASWRSCRCTSRAQSTTPAPGIEPYTALQLEGRDIYVREGCYNCHSQMVRPLRARDRALRPLLAWPANRSTTIRSSSAPSAPGPTSRASAAATPTSGIAFT